MPLLGHGGSCAGKNCTAGTPFGLYILMGLTFCLGVFCAFPREQAQRLHSVCVLEAGTIGHSSCASLASMPLSDGLLHIRLHADACEFEIADSELAEVSVQDKLNRDVHYPSESDQVFQTGRYIEHSKQALEWKKFLAIHPASVQGHLGLGETLQWRGKKTEAIEEYRKALAIDPQAIDGKRILQEACSGDSSERNCSNEHSQSVPQLLAN